LLATRRSRQGAPPESDGAAAAKGARGGAGGDARRRGAARRGAPGQPPSRCCRPLHHAAGLCALPRVPALHPSHTVASVRPVVAAARCTVRRAGCRIFGVAALTMCLCGGRAGSGRQQRWQIGSGGCNGSGEGRRRGRRKIRHVLLPAASLAFSVYGADWRLRSSEPSAKRTGLFAAVGLCRVDAFCVALRA